MQPMAVDIDGAQGKLAFAPKYGQHTRSVLAQAGLVNDEVQALYSAGVVA
jgi:crotonobetainyl-CoA:carnitine CoA-transferase CaiB-like acyl-CoA transferase